MADYPSATEIDGDAKAALVDLLYRLADDDLVIGHRHTEWTGLAPILEADTTSACAGITSHVYPDLRHP